MPTAPPAEPPLGEEKGRRMRGWGAEPMEVLSPDGQMSGCFTQPHVAGAVYRLTAFSRRRKPQIFFLHCPLQIPYVLSLTPCLLSLTSSCLFSC